MDASTGPVRIRRARRKAPGRKTARISTSNRFPSVSFGRIFYATRQEVHAVDAANGKDLWSRTWNNGGTIIARTNDGSQVQIGTPAVSRKRFPFSKTNASMSGS